MSGRRSDFCCRSTDGLTLVEVLAVITIIALLMALLLPAVSSVREAARKAGCANNLKQFGIGMQNYEAAFNAFPPASTGIQGFTFYAVITNYVDDGMANSFGSTIHLDYPVSHELNASPYFPVTVDDDTASIARANAEVMNSTPRRVPQFSFFLCPTRGFREPPNTNSSRLASDYAIVVSGSQQGTFPNSLAASMYPEPPHVPGNMWNNDARASAANFTSLPGPGILNYALGRLRITQAQIDHINGSHPHVYRAGQYLNMVTLQHNPFFQNRRVMDPDKRFQKPYEGWRSRTNASMVPDGLSNTAVLAEKHLAATELGFSGWPLRSKWQLDAARAKGFNVSGFGNDSVQLGGHGGGVIGVTEIAFMTRGIAFGSGDHLSYPAGNQGALVGIALPNGPTIGSWHPGNEVNVLMADGAVRSIGSDIDQMYMLPMLGTRDDTDTRSDGRILSLP